MSKNKLIILILFAAGLLVVLIGVFAFSYSTQKNRLQANIAKCTDLGIKKAKEYEDDSKNSYQITQKVNLKSEYHYSKKLKTCVFKNEYSEFGFKYFYGEIIDLNTNERLYSFSYFPEDKTDSQSYNLENRNTYNSFWLNSF